MKCEILMEINERIKKTKTQGRRQNFSVVRLPFFAYFACHFQSIENLDLNV